MSKNTMSSNDLSVAIQQASQHLSRGEFDRAVNKANDILNLVKDDPNALYILGVAQNELKMFEDAANTLKHLVSKHPQFAIAYQELGLTLYRLNQPTQAIASLRQAITIDQNLHSSWQLLGDISQRIGDSEGAKQAYNYLLHIPKYPAVKESLQLFANGNVAASEQLCRKHLGQFPNDVNALRLLAEIALNASAIEDAKKMLERCLTLEPLYHYARSNYVHLLKQMTNYKLASEQIEILEQNQPEELTHQYIKAEIKTLQGDHESAISIFDELLLKIPDDTKILTNRGHVLRSLGEQQKSIDSYRQAIKSSSVNGEAYWSLSNLKTFRFDINEIENMKKLLNLKNLSKNDAAHINFALGKALEDENKYEASFNYYQNGNTIKNKLEPYSSSETRKVIDRIIMVNETDIFKDKNRGFNSSAPIFILGLPRSGSTLIEQILASHSMVDGTKELTDIRAMISVLSRNKYQNENAEYPELIKSLNTDELKSLGRDYIERTQYHRREAPFFIDKMPNNFMHIGFIKQILPNAKIIDTRRDPIATCFSCYKQMFSSGQAFTYKQEDLGNYYLDYIRLMNHWNKVLPNEVLTVHYEEVVDNLEIQVKKLLDFCGLPFEKQCLEFYKSKRTAQTASSEQVRQPIHRSALTAWKSYEQQLDPLIQILSPLL